MIDTPPFKLYPGLHLEMNSRTNPGGTYHNYIMVCCERDSPSSWLMAATNLNTGEFFLPELNYPDEFIYTKMRPIS